MIDLYTWTTPNGRKISIMLEEVGLPYKSISINIAKDEQFESGFLKISPNNKIPAIVDHDEGISLMESGAILIYLAEKSGKLLPTDRNNKYRVLEWLMLQMGGIGPMLGQTHHFVFYNEGKSPYAEERYLNETARLYGVLERRLSEEQYLAGNYSIADIATWPWIARYPRQRMNLNDYPNLMRWYKEIAARPAVQRGYDIPEQAEEIPMPC
ncbi:MAG: glutathione S-transferase [Rhodospirillaceae bacterium]|nr:glutathione S-transferase [Rhodospirillaceae bacterium]|tara:strand:+ start:3377 stop:4009 length:633 start_codon:yes stop_codon:yes gene_type:complete